MSDYSSSQDCPFRSPGHNSPDGFLANFHAHSFPMPFSNMGFPYTNETAPANPITPFSNIGFSHTNETIPVHPIHQLIHELQTRNNELSSSNAELSALISRMGQERAELEGRLRNVEQVLVHQKQTLDNAQNYWASLESRFMVNLQGVHQKHVEEYASTRVQEFREQDVARTRVLMLEVIHQMMRAVPA